MGDDGDILSKESATSVIESSSLRVLNKMLVSTANQPPHGSSSSISAHAEGCKGVSSSSLPALVDDVNVGQASAAPVAATDSSNGVAAQGYLSAD
ncbi:hypothetical protein V6N13_138342 [Hibiscus sabdariffa]